MEEIKELEYKPVAELETEGNFVKYIGYKPKFAPYLVIAMGVALLFVNILLVRLTGVFFILLAMVVIGLVKDYKVMDIFSKGLMIYGDDEGKCACFVNYDDLKCWTVSNDQSHDSLIFTLNSGNRIVKTTFQAHSAYSAINRIIPEKEENYIRRMEERNRPFDFNRAVENVKRGLFGKK
ncbi:MAG: hypothetical protein Q4D13_06555 [Erysipelotrichaceae bacterium]|nr:hypothetical protein [Erysipelotrichaceae bacterium]